MYFLIPEIQGFPKICILPRFEKLFFPQNFPCDVMAPSAAWASSISGPRSNFENSLGYFSNIIKKICHEKISRSYDVHTRLWGGGSQIGESIFTIKGQTVLCRTFWRLFRGSRGVRRGVSKKVEDARWSQAACLAGGHPWNSRNTRGGCLQGIGLGMAGLSDTSGSPWPPLAIRTCVDPSSSQ
jgi:hypothetical protein